MKQWLRPAAVAALIVAAAAAPAHSQVVGADGRERTQVISANPFGLLLEFFNGEYERVVAEQVTAGGGGSFYTSDDVRYVNFDTFARFYPQDDALRGWAFGAKIGLTSIDDAGTYFGYGFDINRSWLLGRNNNFYVGVGLGLKRLVGVPDRDENGEDLMRYVPTIRLVNVGYAF